MNTTSISYIKPEHTFCHQPMTASLQDFFFAVLFISMANITRKINSYLKGLQNLDDSYKSLEYQSEMHNRHYLRHDNDLDIFKDSIKELKGDIRSMQKYHEQMIINVNHIKQDLKSFKNAVLEDFQDFKELKDSIDKIKNDIKEYDSNHEQFKNYIYDELKLYESGYQSSQESLSKMYRDIKDDVSRISQSR